MNAVRTLLSATILLTSSCALYTSRSSDYKNPTYPLCSYKYVCVPSLSGENNGTATARRTVESGLAAMGFKIISDAELRSLPRQEASLALVCGVTWSGYSRHQVTIEFYDLRNQAKVFSSTAEAEGNSFADVSGTLEYAANLAVSRVQQAYGGFNPALASARTPDWSSWEKVVRSEPDLRSYFDSNAEHLDPIEGIWTTLPDNKYKLAIFRDSTTNGRDFVATILRSDEPEWPEHQVKAEFQRTAYVGVYTTTWYMVNHSKQGTTAKLTDGGKLTMTLRNAATGGTSQTELIKNYPSSGLSMSPEEDADSLGGTGSGSGFLVSQQGLVVTNYHVVRGAKSVDVRFPSQARTYSASVAVKDKGNDLAVLRLQEFRPTGVLAEAPPYAIATSSGVRLGQEVFTLGFPLGDVLGKSPKLSAGSVSSITGIEDDPRMLQISNPIQPGNSGGPLFDADGRLVGIVVSSLNAKYFYERADVIPQNVNFAIKSDYLLSLLSVLPESEVLAGREGRLRGKTRVDQVGLLTPFIVQVITR